MKIGGAQKVPLCLKFGAIPTIIYKVTAFWKNWRTPFFLIGHHLESVSRTEPVFELNLALSKKMLTNEFRSNSSLFYRVIV